MPETKMMRADPPSHAEVEPAMATASTTASAVSTQRAPTPVAVILSTACSTPCRTLTSCCGTASSNANVALQDFDLLLRHRQQQCQRGAQIDQAGQNAAPQHALRHAAAGIANLVAHHRAEFQAHESEADHSE